MLVRAYAPGMRAVMRHASGVPAGVRWKSTKTATVTQTATKPKNETAVASHEQSQDMFGDFVRPQVDGEYLVSDKEIRIAEPQTPPEVKEYGTEQAPNYATTWSKSQRSKAEAMKGPRFEQVDMEFQPAPLSAMELISNVPVQVTTQRVVSCDGGDGPLGHPRVYINLDKPGPKGCPYCGIRYEKHDEHAHLVP